MLSGRGGHGRTAGGAGGDEVHHGEKSELRRGAGIWGRGNEASLDRAGSGAAGGAMAR